MNKTIPVRLLKKLDQLRKDGMINIKFDADPQPGATVEEVANEICDMLEAPKVEETEEL